MTTTLYRPVLIESVEQAEKLPEGTIALHADRWHVEKDDDGGWVGEDASWAPQDVVGWTALVPVEAEEERYTAQLPGQSVPHDRVRLVTPWEMMNS